MTFIVRTIFLDEATYHVFVPQNEGMLRPVKVIAPKGSIFNPNFPRALLRPLLPGAARGRPRRCRRWRRSCRTRSPPATRRTCTSSPTRGFDAETQEYWVYLEVNEGSYGGRLGKDGLDSVDCLIANTRNNPIEELEWRFPMRDRALRAARRSVPRRASGAAASGWSASTASSSTRSSPARASATSRIRRGGSSAAHDGLNASTIRERRADRRGALAVEGDGSSARRPATRSRSRCRTRGGYGDPLERDPEAVLADVLDGFTTVELAERDYGVVIDPATLALDADATARRREDRTVVPA